MRRRVRPSLGEQSELDPIERLFDVFDGKPFQNLSWRLLRLLIDKVPIERREIGPEDTLSIVDDIDALFVESGALVLTDASIKKIEEKSGGGKLPPDVPRILGTGQVAGTWPPPAKESLDWVPTYRHTLHLRIPEKKKAPEGKDVPKGEEVPEGKAVPERKDLPEKEDVLERLPEKKGVPEKKEDPLQYKAQSNTVVRLFFKPDERRDGNRSRWGWLCKRSRVARGVLQTQVDASAEVVLLTSTDLVEYLPALTHLLAEATTRDGDRADGESEGNASKTPDLRVCLVRLDPVRGCGRRGEAPEKLAGTLEVACPEKDKTILDLIDEKKKSHDYVFVDPYDRASRLTQGDRCAPDCGLPVIVNPECPGSTLDVDSWKELTGKIDSIVHVARNFRVGQPDDPEKLNFHAVVLDSRTARFESAGIHDRTQLRSADEPFRAPVDPPELYDDGPTTRLHLNLLRLKKAWEQTPSLDHVCAALDEPNLPRGGDQRGYWQTRGFFDRWVRDLRFRRVGIALGGGGATGFSHVALLGALRQHRIPIDLVSGTSFGALVGAYYCSHGLDGLEMLVEQGLVYTGVVSLTVLSSAVLEHMVNLSIEYRPMWELPIPFYAVATDIEKGEPAVFPGPLAANPSVGFAVRASGGLPGIIAPVRAGRERPVRYVDGGAVSLVPARSLLHFGADVIIGSNAFPFRRNDGSYRRSPLVAMLPPPFNRLADELFEQLSLENRLTDAARTLALTLTPAMQRETSIASATYEHKRTDVKYWEFHCARRVIAEAIEDLATSGALPDAINAVRLLNLPI